MDRFKAKIKEWIKRSGLSSQRGAAAVEFAIIFPMLILLLFAMIEFGLYLFNRQVITNACREGAR
ncbi:MAG: pilus assembly protein, partial [Desulfobacteraceae bacterium]